MLLATPVARSLKQAWPNAELHFLAFKGTEGVPAGNPDIDQVIAFPNVPAGAASWRNSGNYGDTIRNGLLEWSDEKEIRKTTTRG